MDKYKIIGIIITVLVLIFYAIVKVSEDSTSKIHGRSKYTNSIGLISLSGLIFMFTNEFDIQTILVVVAIIFLLMGIYSAITTKMKYEKRKKTILDAQEIAKEKIINDEYNKKAINLYNSCVKHKIKSVDDDNFNIVFKSFDIDNIDVAKKMYNDGLELAKKEEQEELNIRRERERQTYISEEEKSKIIGKDKYRECVNTRINVLEERLKKIDNDYRDCIVNGTSYRLNDIMKERMRIKDEKDAYTEQLDTIEERLCDDGDINTLFKLIKIKDIKYTIFNSRNFSVNISIETARAKIINKEAIIDGSIVVKVFDDNDNLVAKGIYNAPELGGYSFDEIYFDPFEKAGFSAVDKLHVKCITDDNFVDKINGRKEYKCVVEPLNLWLIEKE